MMTQRAVVLARGLGTRMREPDAAAALSEAQRRAADAGSKMMIPVHGRPFLDYALSALADAGMTEVALVVAPDHAAMAAHYQVHPAVRLRLAWIVQPEPLGTANAVLAVAAWAGDAPFLAMNADNLYPSCALEALASLDEPGLAAFERDDLVRTSNIPAERVLAFALVDVDDEGYLTGIVEKPTGLPPEGGNYKFQREADPPGAGGSCEFQRETPAISAFRRDELLISMNCWRFDSRIFDACRDVRRSRRGEYELPDAVGLAVGRGVRFRAIHARGPVLDLSRRADAADVEARLTGTAPRP